MKKLFSIFLCFVLTASFLFALPIGVQANTFATAETVYLNQPYTSYASSSSYDDVQSWTVFNCTLSGYYDLTCEASSAPEAAVYLTVYDADKNVLNYAVNTDLSLSFTAVTYLNAGSSYYFYVTTDSSAYNFDITVSSHIHSFDVSQHVRAIADDDEGARTDGYERLVCQSCGLYYDTAVYYAPSSVTLSKTLYISSGVQKKPSVTVRDRAGTVIPSSEYTVTYEDNINTGKAYVFVNFNSADYDGELTASFIIKPKKQAISSLKAKSKGFTVKWTKNSAATGYEIQYSTSKKFTSSTTKTVTVKKSTTVSKTVKSLKSKKKYYVRVRSYKTIDSVKYYGAWSAKMSVKTKK